MRPSFEQIYMQLAYSVAKRSTCTRLQVGCVITSVDYREVFALGYNGNASGLPNQCDTDIPGACGCLHAEENAIINCHTQRFVSKHVFVTHSPCMMCAKRLINLGGIVHIFYDTLYRDDSPIKILKDCGIKIN